MEDINTGQTAAVEPVATNLLRPSIQHIIRLSLLVVNAHNLISVLDELMDGEAGGVQTFLRALGASGCLRGHLRVMTAARLELALPESESTTPTGSTAAVCPR